MQQAKELAPTPSPSAIFTFGLVVESIKELKGVSPCMMEVCHFFIYCQNLNVCIFIVFQDPTIQKVAFEHFFFPLRSLKQICERVIFYQK
jgi:hypothetical protein